MTYHGPYDVLQLGDTRSWYRQSACNNRVQCLLNSVVRQIDALQAMQQMQQMQGSECREILHRHRSYLGAMLSLLSRCFTEY